MGRTVLRQLRAGLTLLRAISHAAGRVPMPREERGLAVVLVLLSLAICRHVEQTRRRVRDSAIELLVAHMALGCALVLSWLAGRAVRNQEGFGRTVFALRSRVFHRSCSPAVPLVVLSVLWQDEQVTVVHTTCDNFAYLHLLSGPRVWFLVTAHWAKFRSHFRWHRVLCTLLDPCGRVDRVVWLGNSPDEVAAARREGCRAVLVNHNCFINDRHFPLVACAARPRFDAVLNANAGAWKRHHLTRDIPALAYITYSRDRAGRMIWPVKAFHPAYRNDDYLDERQRCGIYADSCCGLTLSACEGANYATVEYLLCGLPVVSTPSRGGRDMWFTEQNSIICEPSCRAVAEAVAEWRRRHERGAVDHARIRAECLSRIAEQRERFIQALQEVLSLAGAVASARAIFETHHGRDELIHALAFQRGEWASRHPTCAGRGWHPLAALPAALGSVPCLPASDEGRDDGTHAAAAVGDPGRVRTEDSTT